MQQLRELDLFLFSLSGLFHRLQSKPIPTVQIDSHNWEELQVFD